MEMIGRRLEAELELFIMDCHALSKDGIISKSEEIVMKRKIYKSLRWLLKQEPDQCRFCCIQDTFWKMRTALYRIKKKRKSPWNWL